MNDGNVAIEEYNVELSHGKFSLRSQKWRQIQKGYKMNIWMSRGILMIDATSLFLTQASKLRTV